MKMKRVTRLFVSFMLLAPAGFVANGQDAITDFLNAGVADGNKLAEAYFRPYGEMFGANLNAGWYNSAKVHGVLGFDITFQVSSTFAPSSKKNYDVNSLGLEAFEVSPGSTSIGPTIVGKSDNLPMLNPKVEGGEYASFSVPDGTGFNIFAAPMIQGAVGLPLHTEVMVRFLPKVGYKDYGSIGLWGLGVKHSIKEYIPFIKRFPIWNLSVMGAYTKLDGTGTVTYGGSEGNLEIGSSAYTVRLLGGVNLPIVAFYAGFGYSNAASTFDLMGTFNDVPGMNGAAVTNPIALKYDEGSYDFNIGTRLRFGIFAIHADYTVGEYNMVTAGFGFNFR